MSTVLLHLPTHKFQIVSYAKCERFWSYAGKLALITRNLLNAAARNCAMVFSAGENCPYKIKYVVTRMKLLSLVSVPFSLVDLKSITQKIFKSMLLHDKEGFAMGVLSFTLTAADAFDSISTFVNSLLSVLENQPIEILSSTGLPIAFVINGTGTVSRIIQIAKACHLYRNIDLEVFSHKDKALLKTGMAKKLGVDEEERLIQLLSSERIDQTILEKIEKLKEKKKAVILRLIPKGAMKAFEKLFELLDVDEDKPLMDHELSEVFKSLKNIRDHLYKKMLVDLIGILANLIAIAALVSFAVGVTSALPFLLLAGAFAIRLLSLIYQERTTIN